MSNSTPPNSSTTIEFTCPRCNAPQRLAASTAGTRQTCTDCQQTYKVPAAGSTNSAAKPQPPAPASASVKPTSAAAPPAPPKSPAQSAAVPKAPVPVASSIVELSADDEAPIPFDSEDSSPDVRIVPHPPQAPEPAKQSSYTAPPSAPRPGITSPSSAPASERDEPKVDRDAFYDDDAPGAGANRPQPKPPAKTVIYVDNKHRVSNDEGLILIVCGVCGTRAHFTPDKGETEQQCPDCFIKFKLPKLPPGPVKQAAPKIDDEDDEFKLADTFERQGYQPLTRDSVSADQIKGGPLPASAFGNLGAPPSVPVAGQIPMASAPGGQVIAPPLPPAFGQPSTPTSAAYIPEPIPPEATAALTAAGAAPSMLDPSHRLPRPPQWAILVDVFNFPFRPLHLVALISFTVLVMIPIAAAVFALATFPGRLMQILMIAVVPPLEAAPFVFVASYFVHIVHDSSYGEKQIQHWNAINLVDNGLMAIYVFCAIFFAGFPGFLISLPFAASEGNAQFLCILVSTVIFFPFCLLSLLEEESYWQVYNHEIAKSFRFSSGHVFLFACSLIVFTGVTGALMFGVGSILGDETSIPMTILALAAMVLVGMYWLFCYGRMVGRLAWVMNYEAQYGPLEDDY